MQVTPHVAQNLKRSGGSAIKKRKRIEESFGWLKTIAQGATPGDSQIGYVGPIEKRTLDITYFRQVLFTGKHTQLVVMCLGPGEEIGDEVHQNVDLFFRIEQGEGKFVFNEKQERLLRDGDAVVVPAGTNHNVINVSKTASFATSTPFITEMPTSAVCSDGASLMPSPM